MDEPPNPGPPPSSPALPHKAPLEDPRALQILATEHNSLNTARSLAYNEAFTRAGMFLSFLSATLIVIGFLIGTQGLIPAVTPVVAVLLVADLFVGTATLGRLIDASGEELQAIRGMNRIRYAYREMVPGLESYFVAGFHDDALGVLATYGESLAPTSPLANMAHGLTTTVGMLATIDAMIVGALGALVGVALGTSGEIAVGVGVVAFVVAFVILAILGMRSAMTGQRRAESRFPTPRDRPA